MVVTGKDHLGTPVTLECNAKDVAISQETEYGDILSEYYGPTVLTSDRWFLEIKPREDGAAFEIRLDTTEVLRTARMEVRALTPEVISAAAKATGVPESTPFRLIHDFSRDEFGSSGGSETIEFYWTEKKVLE